MIVKCPFNYTGSKHSILPQLLPLFPQGVTTCYDLFAGGGSVGVNTIYKEVVFNDSLYEQIGLLEHLYKTPTATFINQVQSCIKEYGLSNTSKYGYQYYGCSSTTGLAKQNKTPFLTLREEYNKDITEGGINFVKLYTLIVYSFNNQNRKNSRGLFNSPVGKRDFNLSMQRKLQLFMDHLKRKKASFTNFDFRNIEIDKIDKNKHPFIYCDPPYLITTATYNEGGNWTEKEEKELLSILDEIDEMGIFFGLSNVIREGDKENKLLVNWIEERNYEVVNIKKTYKNSNYQKKKTTGGTKEVYISNYSPRKA